jgi:hypothetical protein
MLLAACGGPSARQLLHPPEFAPGQAKCHAQASATQPLIVEWPSAARGELEAIVENHKAIAVVHYEGCEMRVLSGCNAPGQLAYVGYRNKKRDQVRIRNADELYANLPVGAASLEAKLDRAGELDVDMMLVGQYEGNVDDISAANLTGDCAGATHVVRSVAVGAFDFHSGASAAVSGGAHLLGAGAGGSTSAAEDSIARDGNVDACEVAKVGDADAPNDCGALVRIEVVELAGLNLDVSGEWADTAGGTERFVQIHDRLYGTFDKGGWYEAAMTGLEARGKWMMNDAYGTFVFTFARDGNTMSSVWGNGDAKQTEHNTYTRTARLFASPEPPAFDVGGTWVGDGSVSGLTSNLSQGQQMGDRLQGTYDGDNGRFYAVMSGRETKGVWFHHNAGRGDTVYSDDGNSSTGHWGIGMAPMTETSTGHRQ